MLSIIQDFAKIINNRITRLALVYFGMIFCIFIGFIIGRISKIQDTKHQIQIIEKLSDIYKDVASQELAEYAAQSQTNNSFIQNSQSKSQNIKDVIGTNKSLIFASKKGKYFYYKGCGGNTIVKKNLVYYKSEAQALAAGKILYSKCK